MKREDVIRMAREAQMPLDGALEHFAALVSEAERDACARICEQLGNDDSIDEMEYRAFRKAEETIRARGET